MTTKRQVMCRCGKQVFVRKDGNLPMHNVTYCYPDEDPYTVQCDNSGKNAEQFRIKFDHEGRIQCSTSCTSPT